MKQESARAHHKQKDQRDYVRVSMYTHTRLHMCIYAHISRMSARTIEKGERDYQNHLQGEERGRYTKSPRFCSHVESGR